MSDGLSPRDEILLLLSKLSGQVVTGYFPEHRHGGLLEILRLLVKEPQNLSDRQSYWKPRQVDRDVLLRLQKEPIDEVLDLSAKARQALQAKGLRMARDVLALWDDRLKELGFSKSVINELKRRIEETGLQLSMCEADLDGLFGHKQSRPS